MSARVVRYLCVHCDLGFEAPEGEEARCPRCMRKGAVARPAEEPEPKPKWLVPAAIGSAAVVALFVVAFVLWTRTQPMVVGEHVPERPLAARELRGHLVRLHADRQELRALFESSDAVDSLFGDAITHGGFETRARAIASRFDALRRSGRLVPADEHGRRRGAFLAPAALARALAAPRGAVEASSLELTLLAVVALRDEDVPARVAEVYAIEGERTPPDRTGTQGFYEVAVPASEGSPDLRFVDVTTGRSARPLVNATRVLDDVEAIGGALAVKASVALARDRDGSGALETVDEAIRLDPRCVTARTIRAALLAARGAMDQALDEADAAERLRPDPPRLVSHASLLIADRPSEAEALARRALETAPDYGAAHGILAAAYLLRRDLDGARTELTTLDRIDPEFDGLALLYANYYMLSNEPDRAAERIEAWVRARPSEHLVRLQAAHTLMLLGRTDAAIGHLRAAVEMVDGQERDALLEQIGQVFGAEVLADVTGIGLDAGVAPDLAPPPSFDLGQPTLGGNRPTRPSLLSP